MEVMTVIICLKPNRGHEFPAQARTPLSHYELICPSKATDHLAIRESTRSMEVCIFLFQNGKLKLKRKAGAVHNNNPHRTITPTRTYAFQQYRPIPGPIHLAPHGWYRTPLLPFPDARRTPRTAPTSRRGSLRSSAPTFTRPRS